MRILHINNTANNAVELRNAQRKLGHTAEVAETWRGMLPYKLDEDHRFYGDNGIGSRLHLALGVVTLARSFDVVHVHGNFPAPLLGLIKRVARKPIVCNFNGAPEFFPDWKGIRRWADAVWVSTPNLLAHYPGSIYVPDPREVSFSMKTPGGTEKIRVVHAYASYANPESVKGSDSIRLIVTEIPGIEYIEVHGKPHDEALAIYGTADIAIDQMIIGWHGAFAIECMMMGIPTLGYVDPKYAAPFLNPVAPITFENLRSTVEKLRDDTKERESIGFLQREMVRERHDPMRIARWTIENYPRRGKR